MAMTPGELAAVTGRLNAIEFVVVSIMAGLLARGENPAADAEATRDLLIDQASRPLPGADAEAARIMLEEVESIMQKVIDTIEGQHA